MTNLRRATISFLAIVLTAAGLLAVSTPAQARPACNTNTYLIFYSWIRAGGFTAPTYGWGNVDCGLWRGMRGAEVVALQRNLNRCYLTYRSQLVVDGDFGRKTQAALIGAQWLMGTKPDGVYGPDTRRKMKWYVYGTNECIRALSDS